MQQKSYKIETLGCKVNQYETTAIEEILQRAGYVAQAPEREASVCIVNTCTVTHTGDKKSRQWISRFRRENPDATIVVMGCYAQVAHDVLESRPDVDLIVGTKEKEHLPALIEKARESAGALNAVTPLDRDMVFAPLELSGQHERTRATLKVQDGCSQFCSYCIIPYARGPVRSRGMASVKEELSRMAALGYKEVVLTGIHLASYGKDTEDGSLLEVIRLAQETQGIERIRLSSLEPGSVTDSFVAGLLEFPKLCDHFHLSLQSGSDAVLRRMNRRYTASEYFASIERLRCAFPNAGLTTDVICGFPGETEAEWEETMRFVREAKFSRLHVFSYSPRHGTPASAMKDQVDPAIKKQRNAELTALGQELTENFLRAQVGAKLLVLVEEPVSEEVFSGYATNYSHVHVQGAVSPNEIVRVKITGVEDALLLSAPVVLSKGGGL